MMAPFRRLVHHVLEPRKEIARVYGLRSSTPATTSWGAFPARQVANRQYHDLLRIARAQGHTFTPIDI